MFRHVVFVWILKVQSTNFMSRTAHAYNVNTLVGQTFTREGEIEFGQTPVIISDLTRQ